MKLSSYRYPRPSDESAAHSASESFGNRPRLIFLHGMGGTGKLWRPIAASLEGDCDLLCPDQRGHGESRTASGETRFGPLDYARDVWETATAEGFSPAWVVGHSMGVRTACGYAKLNPAGVQGLVLVDLGFSGVAGGGIGEALASFLDQLPPSFPSREEARAFLDARCPDPSIAQYLLAVAQVAGAGASGAVVFPFDRQALLRTIEQSRGSVSADWVREYATATGRPVHCLRGAESRVWSKVEYEKDRASLAGLPNVSFREIAGAGHGLPFEKRLAFVAMLREWVFPAAH